MGEAFHSVSNIVAGEGIEVDTTDPHNPVVTATGGGVQSIEPGTSMTVDDTDPAHPIVTLGGAGFPGVLFVPDTTVLAQSADASLVLSEAGVQVVSNGGPIVVASTFPMILPGNADVAGNLDPSTYAGGWVFDTTLDAPLYSNGVEWVGVGGGGSQDSGLVLLASRPAGGTSTCTLYGRRVGPIVTLYLHSSTEGNAMAWNAARWFVDGVDAYALGTPEQPDFASAVFYTGWTSSPGTDMTPDSPAVCVFNNGGQFAVTPAVSGPNVTGELSLTIVYTTDDPFPEPVEVPE